MGLYGEVDGITMIQCTLNIDQNYCNNKTKE